MAMGDADLSPDLFRPQRAAQAEREAISRPSLSYWQDAWLRLKRNRLALVALVILVIMTGMSIFAPMFSKYTYREQNLKTQSQPPSAEYWLGTDDLGRDIWTRLWWGGRISLFIGTTAAVLDLIIGALYGGIAGYFGGSVDDVMMRIIEVLYGFPYLLMVILLMVIMPRGLISIIVAMTLTGWIGMARLVRGQVLQIKEQEFVLAARTLGASPMRIILRHVLPGAIGPMLVSMTLTVPAAIFTEAVLSFIGLGVPLPLPSWGIMASEGYRLIRLFPWMMLFPGIAISLTMLSFNLLGDGLRDALDPRLRK